MKTVSLPGTRTAMSQIIFGCMNIGPGRGKSTIQPEDVTAAVQAIRTALDQGVTIFDHADIYTSGKCEETFSHIWKEIAGLRTRIMLQTKCGIRFPGDMLNSCAPARYDFSYEHILRSVEGSLKRLATDYIDILLLHRPDPLVEPDEVARAFSDLHSSGKVLHFGVSNHTAAQIEFLQQSISLPLMINQVQMSLLHTHLLDEGVSFNQHEPQRVIRNEGTLEYCRMHNIQIQAWSPLARGLLDQTPKDEHLKLVTGKLDALGAKYHVSRSAIAVAWLMRHPARICPVIGTRTPERIVSACEGANVELSREEWYDLFIAGRGTKLP